MRHASRIAISLLFLFAAAPRLMWGQANATGTIVGQITDPSGAVVAGAEVKITDTSTGTSWTVPTNGTGRYVFPNLPPGTYDIGVTMKGFRKAQVTGQVVTVGQALTVNVALELGLSTQTVEVSAVPGAELQTLNSTMGTTIMSESMANLPSINRDVASLLTYSPTAQVTFNGAESNETGGGVGGQTSDENTYMLDGGNNTDDLAGNNGYVNGQNGTVTGAVPTPIESIEEFKVNTNNTTSDFSTSSGAQILLTTKRGTEKFHGSGYEYYQSSDLDSNDWSNNFFGTTSCPSPKSGCSKPSTHSNRFGGSLGGPMLPTMAGGKTFFYVMYEGNRYPRSSPLEKLVPTALFRQGTMQFPDATGKVIQYKLNANQCAGAEGEGGAPCDPRVGAMPTGIAPDVSQLWSKYMPLPNELTASGACSNAATGTGDKLNTCDYRGNITYPLSDNYWVARMDHDFGSKWRWMASYRWFRESNPNTSQVDWGGLLPGDTLGTPASASNNALAPRYFVTGLTTTISPTLTNEFHYNIVRNDWAWFRAGALPQLSGLPALEVGGESTAALIPMNVDTQDARSRLWDGHDSDFRETLSWLKGNHYVQFGGEIMHQWLHFDRYDNVVGGLTQLGYEIYNKGVTMPAAYEPVPCPAGSTTATNCLPSNFAGKWANYYSMLSGMVDAASVVATRSGANLNLNPLGTPLHSYDIVDNYNMYFSDAWKIKPNLTLTYGLNWGVNMPPYEKNREQVIEVDTAGNPITAESYLANSLNAQNAGQVYNPTLGFMPIANLSNAGVKYGYTPWYGAFGPRISAAWSPNAESGFLGTLFGHKTTVLRGGYARIFDRTLPINFISGTVLGDGFLQSVSCTNPSSLTSELASCAGPGKVDPTSAFRIGIDGNTVPLSITPTLPVPVQPGSSATGAALNAPYAELAEGMDPKFRNGVSNQYNFTIQRQLKHDMILEVAYVGVWSNHLFQGLDFGNVPLRMKVGGQTFQQAYDAVEQAYLAGKNPAPQPWFETALAGTNNLNGTNYCAKYASCTAAVVANNVASNLPVQGVTNLFSQLDGNLSYAYGGPGLVSDLQCDVCYTDTSLGFANYNAGVVTLQKRTAKGLTVNANLTYSHALGNASLAQTYTEANPTDVQNLRTDYGDQFYDRKIVFNLLGTYQLPFGAGHRFGGSNGILKRIVGGWSVSPIFSYGSGLPDEIYNDSYTEADQAYGQAYDGVGNSAVPVGINTATLSNSSHFGITSGPSGVGSGSDGYTGNNMFGSNAAQVYNSFTPPLPGINGRSEIGGQIRGQTRWNLDLGFTKDTAITERIHTQIYCQMFNALNHMKFADPFNSLQDPGDFGALDEGQYGVLNNSYTRLIQVGLRVSF